MSVVYLYSYKLPVQLMMTDYRGGNNNMPTVNYSVTVYRNNFNTIEFVVRNNDRKPVKLVDCQLNVIIKNTSSGTVVLEKAAFLTDETKGRAQLLLTPDNTRNWPIGGYEYNIQVKKPDSPSHEFLYFDVNNNATGTFELRDSVGGSLIPAQTMLASQLTPITTDWDEMNLVLTSGAIPANNQVGNNAGLFSVVVYQHNWKGSFRVQGSLENLAPTERSWFDIELFPGIVRHQFDGTVTSPVCFNFSLNVRWIRFRATPEPVNIGTLNKIIYKIS